MLITGSSGDFVVAPVLISLRTPISFLSVIWTLFYMARTDLGQKVSVRNFFRGPASENTAYEADRHGRGNRLMTVETPNLLLSSFHVEHQASHPSRQERTVRQGVCTTFRWCLLQRLLSILSNPEQASMSPERCQAISDGSMCLQSGCCGW